MIKSIKKVFKSKVINKKKKKKKKNEKKILPQAGFEPTTGLREQNGWKIFIYFDRLNQKTLKNHISFWVSHFQYMESTLGSALT